MTESERNAVTDLYHHQLTAWNARDAAALGALYADDANVIGFDGSQVDSRTEIEAHFRQIFTDHITAAYVGKVREVRLLAPDVAVLRAVAGMIPPGQSDLNPDVNAIQTLVALRRDDRWQISLYHNTPAAFHGRPEAGQALTDELRQLL